LWPGYVGDDARLAPFRDNGNNRTAVAFLQGAASIEQDVAGLEVGQQYVLSLDYNARNCCGGAIPTGELYLDDQFIEDFPGPQHANGIRPVGANNPWYHFETTFMAERTTSLLSIRAMPFEGGDSTLVVDNVSIMPFSGLPGDFDNNGQLDAADIDALSLAVRGGGNPPQFDLNGDSVVNQSDRTVWVRQLKRSYFGDSNLDREFSSSDFVVVFTAGQYEDAINGNSTWATGDWDGDGDFSTSDFVFAFTGGGYELGPPPAVSNVPEPASIVLLMMGLAVLASRKRGNVG
jgi:hypothetical protein